LKLPTATIFGLTVFWNTAAIPAVIIGVPILVRAVSPLFGRTKMLINDPREWGTSSQGSHTRLALLFAALFVVLLGVAFFVAAPAATIKDWPGLSTYYAIAAIVAIIFAPISGIIVGSKIQVKHDAV